MFKRIACTVAAALAVVFVGFAQEVRTATLVGTVTDSSGAVVSNAKISVKNADTSVVTPGTADSAGEYYIPYLGIGNYEVTVEAAGFKTYVRTGLFFDAGQTPRIDVQLQVGALTEKVEVTEAAPLLATDTAVVGSIAYAKEASEAPIPQSKPQHLMYYMEGTNVDSGGGNHINGLPESQLAFTSDGASIKQSIRSVIGDTVTSISQPVDSIQQAQVWTTGIPAEMGHSAAGAFTIVTKSGTNELHFTGDDRYINKDFIHRSYFQQGKMNYPFLYTNFNTTLGGPVFIPKLYNGKNKTFFFLGYRLDYANTQTPNTVSVPTPAEESGDFSFGGLGYPIYDPKSIACTLAGGCPSSTGYTATMFPGNQIPASRFDPVATKFLSLNPYNAPNTVGYFDPTGPNNNYLGYAHLISDRQGYLGKIDHQVGVKHRVFVRFAWNKYRSPSNTVGYALAVFDPNIGAPNKTDERNLVFGETWIIAPTLVNEFRLAYQRRWSTTTQSGANEGWASTLGIPGVSPATVPQFVSGAGSAATWTINPSTFNRTGNDDIQISDNMSKLVGTHAFKWGYQGLRVRENDVTATNPSGAYNFTTAGSGLPFTPNTGNPFASFLLGAVSSATFSTLLEDYLPRWWSHQLYVQDEWRALPKLTINIGLRYSFEGAVSSKYGFQSQFNPNVVDPLTGMMGAITHPKTPLYSGHNNFTPRLGVSWNFRPKWVFRGSFGMFTQDNMPEIGQDEYVTTAALQQPAGNPFPAFYLSQGPGPITYSINPSTNTANFVGSNYSSRTATYIDPSIRNPYSMTWSGGVQWEFVSSTLAEVLYQGSAGVGLVGSVNMNVLPQSIYNSTNTTLLNTVYAATQNYLDYPQFGTITATGNYGHSTYHSMIIRVERRFHNGLSYSFMFNWSKNLTGTAGTGWQYYDWALTKSISLTNLKYQFTPQASYDLPVGRGRRFLSHSGTALDAILGGWNLLTIQAMRSGVPNSFTFAGSPYKYLPGETQPNVVPGQAINVPNYAIGPNMWPSASQNPYYNINAFSYPAAFTGGNAGIGIGHFGGIWWPQYVLGKTFTVKEKYKISVKAELNNLFPQTRAFCCSSNPNTVVNIAAPQNFGRFAAGALSYSQWYTPNGHMYLVTRIEF